MSKISHIISIVLTSAILLTACNKNSPEEVAKSWLTSFYRLDYDAARKLSTENTKNFISQLEQFSDAVSDSDKKELRKATITVKNVKVNGNTATLVYNISDMPGKDQPLTLIREGDRWLVQFSKNDQGSSDSTVTPPAEADTSAQAAAPAEDNLADTSKK